MQENSLQTTIFLPYWLATSFDKIFSNQDQGVSSFVLPVLDRDSVIVLIDFIHQVQLQCFSGINEKNKEVKNVSIKLNKKYFYQVSSLLKYAVESQDQINFLDFFSDHYISNHPNQREEIKFTINKNAFEVLFGVIDPCFEISRMVNSRYKLESFAVKQPLFFKKSAWLELAGSELYLYFKMIKSQLWNYSWLDFDSRIFQTFDSFFKDSNFKIRKNQNMSEQKSWLRSLSRFGSKLIDHGVLKRPSAPNFLPFNKKNKRPIVFWSISDLEASKNSLDDYHQNIFKVYKTQECNDNILVMARLYCGSDSSELSYFIQYYKELLDAIDPSADLLLVDGESYHLGLILLDLKFNKSSVTGQGLNELDSDILPDQIRSLNDLSVEDSMQLLRSWNSNSSELIPLFKQKGSILVSRVTRESSEFKKRLQALRKPYKSSVLSASPQVERTAEPLVARASSVQSTTSSPNKKNKKYYSQELLNLAKRELSHMRHNETSKYKSLKELYCQSLVARQQKTINQIEKQMPSDLFNDHIHDRLINFMISHPGSWNTSLPKSATKKTGFDLFASGILQ